MGSDRQGRTPNERFELRLALVEPIFIGVDHDDHVHTLDQAGFGQAPALGNDTSSPIALDGIAILAHGNENGAGIRAAIGANVEPHTLGGPARSLVKHLRNLASRPDALGLPESEFTGAPFVVPHGDQYFFFSSDVLSLVRPLARRLLIMRLPLLVFMRALKPNFLTRRVLLG